MMFWVFEPAPEAKMISVLVAKENQLRGKSKGQFANYLLCFLRFMGFLSEKPFQDLFLVVPEKAKLSKKNGNDEDDDLVSKDEDKQSKQEFPEKVGFICKSNPIWDCSGQICRGCAGNGKRAEDQEQLRSINLPFRFEFFEHAAN